MLRGVRTIMNLKFAVIPWSSAFMKDKMFDVMDLTINRDHLMEPFREMQLEFERQGDELHTIDYYDVEQIDYFLFFVIDWEVVLKVIHMGKADCMIYCNAEPPVVDMTNCPAGYRKLQRIFPYILTWNRDWVDNKTIFKRNIPYFFENNIKNVVFEERRLLTGISGNKHSKHIDELYSERERVYSFFEENYPDDFIFYGTGWDKKSHPCYGGRVENKSEVYHQFKFAICFENMKNVKDYVTEKIWDCLCSGIVPIYAGAENIYEYIPRDCYIDYFEFKNCEELADFLLKMEEEEYQKYLAAAQRLLETDIKNYFSGSEYASCIYSAIAHKKKFEVSIIHRLHIIWNCMKNKMICSIRGRIKPVLKVLRKL